MAGLLVGGDSWTSCWPLEERLGHREFGWPNLVSRHFNLTLTDKSRAGSSNYRIYRKTFDGIMTGTDLAIVCLTSWARFETGGAYGEKPGRIYQHLPRDKKSEEAFKKFFNGYLTYTDMLRQILSLQYVSRHMGIMCLFLDTFDNNLYSDISIDDFKNILMYNQDIFANMDDDRIEEKFQSVKKLEQRIDRSMFISDSSYESLIRGCKIDKGHPVEDGHEKIAGIIIDFLEGINFVNKQSLHLSSGS